MKINVTFEVNSREELIEILQTGKAHSLLDYKILNFKLNPDFTSHNSDYAKCADAIQAYYEDHKDVYHSEIIKVLKRHFA